MLWKTFLKPIIAIFIALLLAVAVAIALNRPPILEAPGLAARGWTYLSQNVAETADTTAFAELRTRRYPQAPAAVFQAAVTVAGKLGWELTDVNEKAGSFSAVAPTRLWRLQDRVEVRVRESGGSAASELYMRSASQFGSADFGSNARRIVVFHELLERRL